MKTDCERIVQDIDALVSDTEELSPESAAHVQHCAVCQKRIAELNAIVAIQREAAANLAAPSRRLSRKELEGALADGGIGRSGFEIRWRPVLAGAIALVLMIGVTVIHRTPREGPGIAEQSKHGQSTRSLANEGIASTLLALQYEVEDGREIMLATVSNGGGTRHYRMKDVESELRD